MIKHNSSELAKSFRNHVNPQEAEELERTKKEIENNVTRILKLIKNDDQSKRVWNSKESEKEVELAGLVEDFYNQYQSLYALYDHLIGESAKTVRARKEIYGSNSPSSSDSEYYSSEEIEKGHHQLSAHSKELLGDNAGDGDFTPSNKPRDGSKGTKVRGTQVSAHIKELEEQLATWMKNLESSDFQKRELEAQIQSKTSEAQKLGADNSCLHAKIMELESALKEKEEKVSSMVKKHKENKKYLTSKFADMNAQINKLESEVKTLRDEKDKMEEAMALNENKASSRIKGLKEQLNVLQHDLDCMKNDKEQAEAQIEMKAGELSKHLIEMEFLKKMIAEKAELENKMHEEKEGFVVMMEELTQQVESLDSQKNEQEEKLRDQAFETSILREENKALHARNLELKKAMADRDEMLSALQREYESGKKDETCAHIKALTGQVDEMRQELHSLREQKTELELEKEKERQEYAISLYKMREQHAKLASKLDDQQKLLKEHEETIARARAESSKAKVALNKSKSNLQVAERKVEELGAEFCKRLEDSVRVLYRRILIAEQLHSENKDNFRLINSRYKQETRVLIEKLATYENELKKNETPISNMNMIFGLDMAARKLEEHTENICKMSSAIQMAHDWAKEKKGEIEQQKNNVDRLTILLDDKEEQEFLLREKVWSLEAKVSKEGGERLNLVQTVGQLEHEVGKLEKGLKDKNDQLFSLGEEKREAIRQLCFVVDYQRNCCDHLKGLLAKMTTNKQRRRT